MKHVCKNDHCTGCMACVDICPKAAIEIRDNLSSFHAVILEEKCVNCGACFKVCPSNSQPESKAAGSWYQGWAKTPEIREGASSGGLASELMNAFIRNGGEVCSCSFENGEFIFSIESQVENLKKYAGSKYVKSNPEGIHREISSRLKIGKKVLFIGLPCQVAGLKKYVNSSLQKNLYTVDLICHGTPSTKVLEAFLKQYGYGLGDIRDIRFRIKSRIQITDQEKALGKEGIMDTYSIAFMYALCYTENCYHCLYAKPERVSDLTIGDSWGSVLSESEQKKGISLVLCQTEKGNELLEKSNLHLEEVDVDRAILFNRQLVEPSEIPKMRRKFLEGLEKGKKFNYLVYRACPKKSLKQLIKRILIFLKIYNGGG